MSLTQDIKNLFTGESETRNLKDLFLHGLKDIYYAEKSLHGALEDMAGTAQSHDLKQAFSNHRTDTKHQIKRLETIFSMIGHDIEAEECEAIEGLITEGREIMADAEGAALDAGLIYAGQAVEHYEIARYTSLITWARELGMEEAASLLQQSLQEEKAADALLTRLAEGGINHAALLGLEQAAAMHAARSKPRQHTAGH